MIDLYIKQGEALIWAVIFQQKDQTNSWVNCDLTGFTAASQVRDVTGNKLADLPLTVTQSAGIVSTIYPNTNSWPIGTQRCDVRLTGPAGNTGAELISETFAIHVMGAVTQ